MVQTKTTPNKTSTRSSVVLFFTIVTMSILFFFGGPDSHASRHFKALWNIGHILYFALLPLLIVPRIKKRPESFISQAALILAATLVLGLLIELIQANFQRTPDIGDLIRNMIGAMVCISFLLPIRKNISKIAIRSLQAATTALVVLQFYPIFIAFADEYIAHNQFPVLSGFETPYELQRWTGDAEFTTDRTIRHSGQYSLKIVLKTTRYSGVILKYFPKKWQGFRQFSFSAFNPSPQPLSITCRIHDRTHTRGAQKYRDRFNRSFSLPQGWSTISIELQDVHSAPANRKMDMSHILGIGIFATALENPRVIYIDDVMLME